MFLHTPLSIIERHPHSSETIPRQGEIPPGVDATISEGWKDLKVKNETQNSYQIIFEFDDEFIHGSIYSDKATDVSYALVSENLMYAKEEDGLFRYNEIYRIERDKMSQLLLKKELLFKNRTEIKYQISEEIIERRAI